MKASPAKDPKISTKAKLVGVALAGLTLVSMLGVLDGPWIGILVGGIFSVLGLMIAFSVFGPYESKGLVVLLQAPGRLLLGAVMIFLGGLGVVSGTADMRPSLVWRYPKFGDLRTLFWDRADFQAMACRVAPGEDAEALRYALRRSGGGRFGCPGPGGSISLLERTEGAGIDSFLAILEARCYDQGDLDRQLNRDARQGPEQRLRVQKLVAAGANPNVEIDGATALGGALLQNDPQLAMWLLENGAQANFTYLDGTTLLDQAARSDRAELRPVYEEMLRRGGAGEPPRLEQPPG